MRSKENKNIDNMLYQALSPGHEPGEQLNQQVLRRAQERLNRQEPDRMGSAEKPGKYHKVGWIAKAAALLLMLAGASGTVYAAWRLYTAEEVAQHVNNHKLAQTFHESAGQQKTQNVVQAYGGYQVTLLGVASGEDISDFPMGSCPESLQTDRTYAAVAIQREDGTPMTEDGSFFVSPLIQGYDPVEYNAVTMRGAATFFEEDGVLYWLMNCSNVEYFADHTIYLCVTDTDFYQQGLYTYDETDGSISRNEDYDGLNALFELELDAGKADPVAAQTLLEENRDKTELEEPKELAGQTEQEELDEVHRFLSELTVENIEESCILLKDTCQTMMPDEEGRVYFEYSLSYLGASSGGGEGGLVDYLFRPGQWGDENHAWTGGGTCLADLTVSFYTLNEDGSVSFCIYVPRDVSIYLP